MKPLILLAIVSVLGFAQAPAPKAPPAAKAGTKSTAAKKAPTTKTGAKAAPKTSSARLLNPAAWTRRAPEEFKVKFTTTKGDFVVDVHRVWAPLGADRFYNLVRSGYFTNVSFYRVVPGFVVQFGAAPDPKVGAAWMRATIKDDPVKGSNKKGSVTFAMGGPNTRTTELFINLRDNAALDGMGFSPLGEITEGMEIVEQLYSGYGDMAEQGGRGPSQSRVQAQGKVYLDKSFPNLDSIKSASLVAAETSAPAPAAGSAAPKAAPKSAAPVTKKTQPVAPAKK